MLCYTLWRTVCSQSALNLVHQRQYSAGAMVASFEPAQDWSIVHVTRLSLQIHASFIYDIQISHTSSSSMRPAQSRDFVADILHLPLLYRNEALQ